MKGVEKMKKYIKKNKDIIKTTTVFYSLLIATILLIIYCNC